MTNFGQANGGNKGEKWGLFALWGGRRPLPAGIHRLTVLVVVPVRGLAARHLTAAEVDTLCHGGRRVKRGCRTEGRLNKRPERLCLCRRKR